MVQKSFRTRTKPSVIISCTILAAILLLPTARASAKAPISSSQAVINAIKRGADALLADQNPNTMWEDNVFAVPPINDYGGETALVMDALLNVNASLNLPELNIFSPKMRRAIHFLVKLQPKGTYTASFQANAMALLPNKSLYRQVLYKDAQFLIRTIHSQGGYSYTMKFPLPPYGHPVAGPSDNSNTQYGVLGVWACAHAGLEIPTGYWRLAQHHWQTSQFANGAWGYNNNPDAVKAITMTPAGVASLFICDEFLFERPTLHSPQHKSLARGLAWLDKNYNPNENNFYAMYGDERVALASGIQTIGGHNWYNNFVTTLVGNHGGPWGYGGFSGSNENISTAYALLVLDRGLNPVVINKLQYTKNFFGDWNARQRDVANFTSWLGKTYETPLNWQVVNIQSSISDWISAPILFIDGSHDPHFTKAQIGKIRQYIQAGGMVFSSCNGASMSLKGDMIKYARQVVHGRYQVKPLTMKSCLYTMQPWFHPQQLLPLLAVSNGIRYLWVISSRDIGAMWQSRQYSRKAFWALPANLYFYATGKTPLSNRLKSLAIPPSNMTPITTLTMAEVQYHGNWNPEPGAWQRMAQIAATYFQTALNIQSTPINAKLNPKKFPLAHMTGTGTFDLNPGQILELRRYLRHGGMMFADAGGGHPHFTDSFQLLAGKLFPGSPLKSIPLTSSIYQGTFANGRKISKVAYRKFQSTPGTTKDRPGLLGIKWHNHWVIVFSPDDITSGLLGTNTWGIRGYMPPSAQALARNVILYAAAHAPVNRSNVKMVSPSTRQSKRINRTASWP